jgi:hypothetical protein
MTTPATPSRSRPTAASPAQSSPRDGRHRSSPSSPANAKMSEIRARYRVGPTSCTGTPAFSRLAVQDDVMTDATHYRSRPNPGGSLMICDGSVVSHHERPAFPSRCPSLDPIAST